MRESRMSGSVGGPGGQPPGPTRPGRVEPRLVTAKASLGPPDGGTLGVLRAVALIAVVGGAVGSVASMVR